jgi:hypothetical protein
MKAEVLAGAAVAMGKNLVKRKGREHTPLRGSWCGASGALHVVGRRTARLDAMFIGFIDENGLHS